MLIRHCVLVCAGHWSPASTSTSGGHTNHHHQPPPSSSSALNASSHSTTSWPSRIPSTDTDDPLKPKCPECGKQYSNNSNLKQHIVNVHTVTNEIHPCPVCGKNFKTKQYAQIHMLSMHGIRKRQSMNSSSTTATAIFSNMKSRND